MLAFHSSLIRNGNASYNIIKISVGTLLLLLKQIITGTYLWQAKVYYFILLRHSLIT